MDTYINVLKENLKHLTPREIISQDMKKAAVIAIFLNISDKTHLLFIKKADDIGYHSGQVSFPGGTIEKGETPIEAALRETEEEIGIGKSKLEILGRFDDDSAIISNFIVTPFAAILKDIPEFTLQKSEVKEAFTVPFEFLLKEANYREQRIEMLNTEFLTDGYEYKGHIIWGLTNRLVRRLVEIVGNSCSIDSVKNG